MSFFPWSTFQFPGTRSKCLPRDFRRVTIPVQSPMNPDNYDRFSVVRLLPAFFVLALTGCVAGELLFHIPLEDLGVAVSVWMVCAFVISRILVLVVPRIRPREMRSSLLYNLLSIPPFLGLLFGPVFFCAGGIYKQLGMFALGDQSLHIGYTFVGLIAADVVAITLSSLASHASVRNACVAVFDRTVQYFWHLLSSPTRLSRASRLEQIRVYHP